MTTEESLESAFVEEGISFQHQQDIFTYLTILRNRDEPTYFHSMRVGLLARNIACVAQVPGVSPKILLWAGSLHDIGKTLIAPALLTKTSAFTAADYAGMEPHVKYGWDMLNQVHDYTAHILVRHHQFGPQPYPAILPPLPDYLVGQAPIVNEAARQLALADYYDALMHRKNDKFGCTMTVQEKRQRYRNDNADKLDLIVLLESVGVLFGGEANGK